MPNSGSNTSILRARQWDGTLPKLQINVFGGPASVLYCWCVWRCNRVPLLLLGKLGEAPVAAEMV
jgi:hypothetical protein